MSAPSYSKYEASHIFYDLIMGPLHQRSEKGKETQLNKHMDKISSSSSSPQTSDPKSDHMEKL